MFRSHVLFFSLFLILWAEDSLLPSEDRQPPEKARIRQIGIQLERRTGKLDGTVDLLEGDAERVNLCETPACGN